MASAALAASRLLVVVTAAPSFRAFDDCNRGDLRSSIATRRRLTRAQAKADRLPPVNTRKSATAADVDNCSRLMQAATDAFAELGYEGASLRAIADTAGVSFQLIAYYFGSKEELWIATVEFLFERYLETGKGLGFTTSGNLAEQFHSHLRLLLTDMLQRPQLRKIWIL